MISGRILSGSTLALLLPHIRRTETFWERTRGLLGCSTLEEGQGLLITPCNSIHTLFMKISIDVVFLNENNLIIAIKQNMRPQRFAMSSAATSVLELMSGQAGISGLKAGDQLLWESLS